MGLPISRSFGINDARYSSSSSETSDPDCRGGPNTPPPPPPAAEDAWASCRGAAAVATLRRGGLAAPANTLSGREVSGAGSGAAAAAAGDAAGADTDGACEAAVPHAGRDDAGLPCGSRGAGGVVLCPWPPLAAAPPQVGRCGGGEEVEASAEVRPWPAVRGPLPPLPIF